MENLKKCILNGDVIQLEMLIADNLGECFYDQVCEIYEECEVRNVVLGRAMKQSLTKFIVNYRFNNQSDHVVEDNFMDRIQLLREVIEEFSANDFKFKADSEMILFLKLIVKLLNVLKHDKSTQTIPWSQIHFLICIFAAVKSNRPNTRFIDAHFQLILRDEIVFDQLRKLSQCLQRINENKVADTKNIWTDLKSLYKVTRNYYLLQKILYHLKSMQSMDLAQFQKRTKVWIRFV